MMAGRAFTIKESGFGDYGDNFCQLATKIAINCRQFCHRKMPHSLIPE